MIETDTHEWRKGGGLAAAGSQVQYPRKVHLSESLAQALSSFEGGIPLGYCESELCVGMVVVWLGIGGERHDGGRDMREFAQFSAGQKRPDSCHHRS